MTAPPQMRDFTVDAVTAWWIACDLCADSELVYGSTADVDAVTWATAHVAECSERAGRCPYCQRRMTNREAAEQAACNDCHEQHGGRIPSADELGY